MKSNRGRRVRLISAPLTAALDVVERSVTLPKTLCSGRNPGSQFKGVGMDTRAGLDFFVEEKIP
jgi:hypothetical protein